MTNMNTNAERVAQVSDGGVGIFLAPTDLTLLGVKDADKLAYAVENGGIRIREISDA